jgi:hypothetical protein
MPVAERLRRLIDRLSPADRTRLLSIAGMLDQIVQLDSEHDEKLTLGAEVTTSVDALSSAAIAVEERVLDDLRSRLRA